MFNRGWPKEITYSNTVKWLRRDMRLKEYRLPPVSEKIQLCKSTSGPFVMATSKIRKGEIICYCAYLLDDLFAFYASNKDNLVKFDSKSYFKLKRFGNESLYIRNVAGTEPNVKFGDIYTLTKQVYTWPIVASCNIQRGTTLVLDNSPPSKKNVNICRFIPSCFKPNEIVLYSMQHKDDLPNNAAKFQTCLTRYCKTWFDSKSMSYRCRVQLHNLTKTMRGTMDVSLTQLRLGKIQQKRRYQRDEPVYVQEVTPHNFLILCFGRIVGRTKHTRDKYDVVVFGTKSDYHKSVEIKRLCYIV